jgi:predicted PurR-regulated permease PerM
MGSVVGSAGCGAAEHSSLRPILGLLGVIAAGLRWGDWQHPLYVLLLYSVIVVVEGFVLQPYIMR